MKALAADRIGLGIESATLRDVPDPLPGAGQVRVRVLAGALNAADLIALQGKFASRFIHAKSSPHILGYDFSGVIDSLGAGVAGFSRGQAVFGFLPYDTSTRAGTFADFVVADADSVGRKPDAVPHVDAACAATAGVTALQGLRDKLGVRRGDRVLVIGGSGGVGTFAVQIARALGADVLATASSAKLQTVKELGASEVYDYRTTHPRQLPGRFDAIFDTTGHSSWGECRPILAPEGRFLALLPSLSLALDSLRALFSKSAVRFLAVKSVPADLETVGAWLADGTIRAVIGSQHALNDTTSGLRLMKEHKVTGKVGITLGNGANGEPSSNPSASAGFVPAN